MGADAVGEAKRKAISCGLNGGDFDRLSNLISDITLGTGDQASQQKLLENLGVENTKQRGVSAYTAAMDAPQMATSSRMGSTTGGNLIRQIRQGGVEGRDLVQRATRSPSKPSERAWATSRRPPQRSTLASTS